MTVLLLSLQTQAAGLTLVRANHVFLLEPALDPAIEQQVGGTGGQGGLTQAVDLMQSSCPPPPCTPPSPLPMQAVARVHRIGQTRDTFVTRLLVDGTVEVEVLKVGVHHD